jgi:hypothetical protein
VSHQHLASLKVFGTILLYYPSCGSCKDRNTSPCPAFFIEMESHKLPSLLSLPGNCDCRHASGSGFFSTFSLSDFTVSCFICKSLIHFSWFFYKGWIKSPISFFCMWTSSFLNSIYWRDYPFPIMCSWHHCQKSVDYKCMDLFLDSL